MMRRRSSVQITLVLIGGMLVLGGCGKDERHVYKNRQDCLDDWGNDPANCEEVKQGDSNYRPGYFYGPRYTMGRTYPGQGSRAVKSVSVSRGGFGSLSSFHSSFSG